MNAASPSIAPEPIRDRGWWSEESLRVGTDWVSIGQAALEMLAAAGIIERAPSTFELTCERADRERP